MVSGVFDTGRRRIWAKALGSIHIVVKERVGDIGIGASDGKDQCLYLLSRGILTLRYATSR